MRLFFFFFFFQAEDGIRDHCVTGVQTCALPISGGRARRRTRPRAPLAGSTRGWNGGLACTEQRSKARRPEAARPTDFSVELAAARRENPGTDRRGGIVAHASSNRFVGVPPRARARASAVRELCSFDRVLS